MAGSACSAGYEGAEGVGIAGRLVILGSRCSGSEKARRLGPLADRKAVGPSAGHHDLHDHSPEPQPERQKNELCQHDCVPSHHSLPSVPLISRVRRPAGSRDARRMPRPQISAGYRRQGTDYGSPSTRCPCVGPDWNPRPPRRFMLGARRESPWPTPPPTCRPSWTPGTRLSPPG